jgi:hypothetical protein
MESETQKPDLFALVEPGMECIPDPVPDLDPDPT